MTVTAVLLANLDDAYERKAWHGTNLRGSLRGLTLEQLVWRPAKGRNNIWELAGHAAYWKYTVWRRLTGQKRGSFPLKGSNFFPSPERPLDAEWRDVLALLDSVHRKLREAVAALPPRALSDAKTVRTVYGVAAHDLYHTGQIQLLKRLQG
ncbi:MAG TPA: DinB family protein [Thermoanaerobaculia bacterium]|nr:DinB family protein [Thermoanaerobaculia bacterium]